MNEQKAPESIVRKIQLLLNLANSKTHGASNEEEAAAAMGKAQELLAKYNLDMAVVGATRVSGSPNTVEDKRTEQRMPRTAQYRWQVKLAKAICEANFCWHWVIEVYETERYNRHGVQKLAKPQRMKRHVILGKESNRIVAEMMYGYLMDTIENILPYPNAERLSRAAQSWREGCVDRLCERIAEKARKMQEVDVHQTTESQSTALAIRSIHESEYAANYDARYGAGAWARAKERERKWAEEAKKEREQRSTAIVVAAEPERKETEAQRRKREEKEQRDNARWWKQYEKRQEKERNRIDHSAYAAGSRQADNIGLDSQLKQGQPTKHLG